MKKVICSEKAPGAIGPYSQAIEANGMVFVSGQLPIDAATGQMAEGIEGQARQSLENIKHILEEAGLTMGNIVKTSTTYPTVVEAVQAAKKNCPPKDLIFVGGSSFIVADLLANRDTLNLY